MLWLNFHHDIRPASPPLHGCELDKIFVSLIKSDGAFMFCVTYSCQLRVNNNFGKLITDVRIYYSTISADNNQLRN